MLISGIINYLFEYIFDNGVSPVSHFLSLFLDVYQIRIPTAIACKSNTQSKKQIHDTRLLQKTRNGSLS